MKLLIELIIMFVKLFIVYKASLFITRVIMNLIQKGLKFVFEKAKSRLILLYFKYKVKLIKIYFACKKSIKSAKLSVDETNTKPEPEQN